MKKRETNTKGERERGGEKPSDFLCGIIKEKHKLMVVLIDTKVEGWKLKSLKRT